MRMQDESAADNKTFLKLVSTYKNESDSPSSMYQEMPVPSEDPLPKPHISPK